MAGLSLVLSLTAFAGEPRVVLLDLGPDPVEDAVVEELRLGGVEVEFQEGQPGFADAPLDAQLGALQAHAGHTVVWVVRREDTVHGRVAFVAGERSVVRAVDTAAGEGDAARLALATREILREEDTVVSAAVEPPRGTLWDRRQPEVEPVPAASWFVGSVGLTLPTVPLALGERVGAEAMALTRLVGDVDGGVGLGGDFGRRHGRGTVRVLGRWQVFEVGVAADLAVLPWVTWVQPRIELAVAPVLERGFVPRARVRIAPVRDQVEQAGDPVYDSGIIEFGISLGGQRQIGQR